MCLLMHLFYTARDVTSHALGTIASAMGPCGVLGALGMSATTYLLLQFEACLPLLGDGEGRHLICGCRAGDRVSCSLILTL